VVYHGLSHWDHYLKRFHIHFGGAEFRPFKLIQFDSTVKTSVCPIERMIKYNFKINAIQKINFFQAHDPKTMKSFNS
jgi:hypothetical protein